jgi:hypothetical protein
MGGVLKAAGSDSLVLRQEKVLKNEYGGDIATTVHLGDSSALLFKTGSERNQRVIVFGNYSDCNVVLASPENLTEAARSLAAHPSIDRSRPRLGVSPMPTWHIPSGLR